MTLLIIKIMRDAAMYARQHALLQAAVNGARVTTPLGLLAHCDQHHEGRQTPRAGVAPRRWRVTDVPSSCPRAEPGVGVEGRGEAAQPRSGDRR